MRMTSADFVKSFQGWVCYHLAAGVIGSVFYLHFRHPTGLVERVTKHQPKNAEFRPQPGEMILNTWCAAWRIEDLASMTVVTTFDDDNSPSGPLLAGLRRLVGRAVTEIVLEEPGLDCRITFDQGLRLSIFPVGVDASCPDNYMLWTSERMFTVGPRSTLSFRPCRDGTPYEETPYQ